MANFAKLDDNNKITSVIVINNNEILDENNIESEQMGIDLCTDRYGGSWIQTSYNGNIRNRYGGIGYEYDLINEKFIPEKPFNSWTLNTTTYSWDAPVEYPDAEGKYIWNESMTSWDAEA